MTLLEFEAWVAEHYVELAQMAKRAQPRSAKNLDALHVLLEGYCDGSRALPKFPVEDLRAGYFFKGIRQRGVNLAEAEAALKERERKLKLVAEVLGDDVFVEVPRAARDRKYRAKKQPRDNEPVSHMDLLQGQVGDTRWVYQQRRDARLYDGQAAQSLGEHIRERSARSLHGAGRSLVQFGVEVAMDPREMDRWRTEVKAYKEAESWTWVSSQTGQQYHGKKWIGQDSPGAFGQCGGCSEHAISGRHDKACALKKGVA